MKARPSAPCVLISLCLTGVRCRYDGQGNGCKGLERLTAHCVPIPVCPEQIGGLPTPRIPAERRGSRVVTRDGGDVTEAFCRGAEQTMFLAEQYGARYALLKSRSPSCGCGRIYDGTFSGRIVPGDGVTAALLKSNGVSVFDENHIDALIEAMESDGC